LGLNASGQRREDQFDEALKVPAKKGLFKVD
jgi:hypothetical protein